MKGGRRGKNILKWLKTKALIRRGVSWGAAQFIRGVFATSRWTTVGEAYPQAYWKEKTPVIVCFWHGRILMVAKAWRSAMPFSMLISGHPDGEMIARTVGHLGIRWIKGSSSQKGFQAFRLLRQALGQGQSIGVTPDGPRGPRYSVSQGVVRLSLLAGVDILPLAFSVRRHRFFLSWDRFLLAFPFTSGVMVWGEPLSPQNYGGDVARFCTDLRERLMDVTQQADALCGLQTPG
jgi:lysophospholipid acyltransferase (LPLAT)-like uncharacterized protein